MIDQLLKQHSGEIASLLGQYGLQGNQASGAADSIIDTVGGFFKSQAGSGNLGLDDVMDLFNKNTPNQGNSIFSQLSPVILSTLLNNGIGKEIASKIATNGLDDILKIFQGGNLGNIDMNTVTNLVGSLTGGKGGDLGGLLGNLGGLFGKK
jgi:hypothetical protein